MAVTSKLPQSPVNAPDLVPVGQHAGAPTLHLDRAAIVVGGDNKCHLHLASPQVSQHHTLIVTTADEVYVRDLCSRTHTYVNEEPVREAVLKHGDFLRMGSFCFKLSDTRQRPSQPVRACPLEVRLDGKALPLPSDSRTVLIGSRQGCDVLLNDESVSTIHAVIFAVGPQYMVRDFYSRNGTYRNDQKIHQEELPNTAILRVGKFNVAIQPAATGPDEPKLAETAVPAMPAPLNTASKHNFVDPLAVESATPNIAISAVSSVQDDEPMESLGPVMPVSPEAFVQSDASALPGALNLGLTVEETASVPQPGMSPAPVESPQPSMPVAPPTESLPPLPHVAPAPSSSFSLDDGFFGGNLNAAGITVRAGGQPPPGAAPISQAASVPPGVTPAGGVTPFAPMGMNMDFALGGIGISLPDLAPPPQDFGRVSVSFGDKDLPQRPRPATIRPTDSSVEDDSTEVEPVPERLRAGPVGKFTTVPKALSVRAGPVSSAQQEIGDNKAVSQPAQASGTGLPKSPSGIVGTFEGLVAATVRQKDAFSEVEPTALNDAAFGGQRLSKSDDYVIPETPGRAAGEEILDFSEDPFWDSDDDNVDPPARILRTAAGTEGLDDEVNIDPPIFNEQLTELAPGAPAVSDPVAAAANLVAQKSSGPEDQIKALRARVVMRLDQSPLRRPPPTQAVQPRGPQGQPVVLTPRPMKNWIPLLVVLMLVSAALALVIIYYAVSAKSTVTGSLQFKPLTSVASATQLGKWQESQRSLIGRQETAGAARRFLSHLSRGTDAGFLADATVSKLAAQARFSQGGSAASPTVLSLKYVGPTDPADTMRMQALLQAVAQADAPISAAARRQAEQLKPLDDEINACHRRQDDLAGQQTALVVDLLKTRISPGSVSNPQQAMQDKLGELTSAEQTLARHTDHLNWLLCTVPGAAPAVEPAGDSLIADDQLSILKSNLKNVGQSLSEARDADAKADVKPRQDLQEAVDQLSREITAADTIDNNSQLVKFINSTRQQLPNLKDLTAAAMADSQNLAKLVQKFESRSALDAGDQTIVAACQELIDNQHKKIAERRNQLAQIVGPLQEQMDALISVVDKIPTQQALIRTLKSRLDTYIQMRSRFDAMTDAIGQESEKMKTLLRQVDKLTGQISQRQQDLIDATQKGLTDQQRAAAANLIAAARQTVATDQTAVNQARSAYKTALAACLRDRINQEKTRQAEEQLSWLTIQLDQNQKKLEDLHNARLQAEQAAGAVFDLKPVTDDDVQQLAMADNRQAYSLLSIAGIAIVFSFLILLAKRNAPHPAALGPIAVKPRQPPVEPMESRNMPG